MREQTKSARVIVIGLFVAAMASFSAFAGDEVAPKSEAAPLFDNHVRTAGGEGGTGPQTSTDVEQNELFIYCPQGISGECQRLSKKQLKAILSQEKEEGSQKD
jgi:hypothetical protein